MKPFAIRIGALALFICILSAAVWVIVYYGQRMIYPIDKAPAAVSEPVLNATTTLDWTSLASSASADSRIEVGVNLQTFFGNPFSFSATNTYPEDLAWQLVDASKTVLASGSIPGFLSSYSAAFDRYWYEKVPASRFGVLIVARPNGEAPLEFPVRLETTTQTVEVYFRNPVLSNCGTVEPVKRTIVSVGDDEVNYYEAAVRELLHGPKEGDAVYELMTMIPSSTRLLKVGKQENGRLFADFDDAFDRDIAIDCFRLIAEKQVQETLATVPYPGRRLTGILMINGEEADWEL